MTTPTTPLEWKSSEGLVPYLEAVAEMEDRVKRIHRGEASECIWLLEHPPLYTAGVSANETDLLDHGRFPVFATGRGGQYTYHGPGQRIIYTMLDLKKRHSEPDVRQFVKDLERWVIASLARVGIEGQIRDRRIGIWVMDPADGKEKKIAALGIKLKSWISYHGIAINIHPDLSHYAGIVPCGISEYGVTSLHALGKQISLPEFDAILKETFAEIF